MRDRVRGESYHWLLHAARTMVDISTSCSKEKAKEGQSQKNEYASENRTQRGEGSSVRVRVPSNR